MKPARIPVDRSFSQTESLRRKVLGQYLDLKHAREAFPIEVVCRVAPSQTRCLLVNVPDACVVEKRRANS